MVIKVINLISKNAKLPLILNRGSEKQRFRVAKKQSDQFFALMEKQNGDIWYVKDFEQNVHQIKGIDVRVVPEDNSDKSIVASLKSVVQTYTNLPIDKKYKDIIIPLPPTITPLIVNKITGFEIKLPINPISQTIQNKFTAIHEIRHFFDHIYNPKLSNYRAGKVALYPEESTLYTEIKDDFLNRITDKTDMRKFKKIEQEKIEQLPNFIRIELLQDLRCSLKTEINAYNQELRMRLTHHPLSHIEKMLSVLISLNQNAKFKEKLKFADKLLTQYIKTERQNLK